MKKLLLIPVVFFLSFAAHGQSLPQAAVFDPFAIVNMEVYIVNDSPYTVYGTIQLSATNGYEGTFFNEPYTMLPYSATFRPFATFSLTNPTYYISGYNCLGDIGCTAIFGYKAFTPVPKLTWYITGQDFEIKYE